MPPQLIVEASRYDPAKVIMTIEEIRRHNPQRWEMEQLSGVLLFDPARGEIVTFKDVTEAEFWARGHIPGRPLMPGVMMVEAAAQMCSLYYSLVAPSEKFIGFGGVDGVKFRGQVVPGDRLILLGKAVEIRSRRAVFDTQGLVRDRLVFEGRITGMPL